jgi:hypothetical protein
MTMVLYNTSKQQMQHQLQVVAYAGNEMELSQATTNEKNAYLILAFISTIWLMNSSLKQP